MSASPSKKTALKKRKSGTEQTSEKAQAQHQYASEKRLENEKLASYLGANTAKTLKTHFGLETVGDFLEFYPRKYLPRGELSSFADLIEGSEATLIAKVLKVTTRQMKARRGSITEITITDQLGEQGTDRAGLSQQLGAETGRVDYRFTSGGNGTPNTANPRIHGSAAGYSDSYAGHSAYGYYPEEGIDMGQVFGGYAPNHYALAGDTSTMTLSFFNAWTAAREISVGDHVMFSGKVGSYRGQPTLTNPHYAVLAENQNHEDDSESIERTKARANAPIPVYRATAKLPTDHIATAMEQILDRAPLAELEDPIPASIRRQRKIPSLAWTYRGVHTPDSEETWRAAQHFLRYREAFILQSALARIRAARAAHATVARPFLVGGYADQLLELLPYELTDGQQKVGIDIAHDLGSQVPMNRLLQGDVGSGKTVVALRAMLQVVDNGAQAAMLAPTEVLAEQHYRSVLGILGDLAQTAEEYKAESQQIRVVLLTASMSSKLKKRTLLEIASGAADIVIGTHALLADAVSFFDLGMVVVDEQHRFGVEQRDALRGANGDLPHRLVMTATPIPRTVAMTVFGDLDTSVLDQLPAGRQKIKTVVVSLTEHPTWERRIWERAREEIDAGHQVYVVVPKIGAGDSATSIEDGELLFGSAQAKESNVRGGNLNSVTSMMEELSDISALNGVRIAPLHGKMDTSEKAETMRSFERGEIDVLVCTTVIEVGVNVPNATLMIIMDADRFGISGLHQLRGRIGRGQLPGTCLLVTTQDAEGVSRERLNAVASTTDGFELSRIDLEQRREGDILGAAQSGNKSTLKLLRALTDAKLIEKAREDAFSLVEKDPTLAQHPDLARTIDRALDADREAFLGRG
ncbi:ATP-dependent DNA helicase RecG [uncultured Rothia sp.]|uniref:ATP-dependent DNA helicase RecG n=1 Tax=uncultured Rothia sp. TaxID=316088 RepID=UPI0032172E59